MLIRRVLTAVVLLALLIPALLSHSRWPFLSLTLLLVAAAAWEWSRLNGGPGIVAMAWGGLVALACAAVWQSQWLAIDRGAGVWWALGAGWLAVAGWALRRGAAAWQGLPGALRRPLGFVLLVATWSALAFVFSIGTASVLSAMALVWIADVAAYFGGRRWGRRRLAPQVSPGKTWEGVISGMVAVLLLASAWVALETRFPFLGPSLYSTLLDAHGVAVTVVLLSALTGLSVVGDLFESLVKRAAGVKDSSALLPGHGGVLDRIDALLPVFPVVAGLLAWSARP